MEEMQERAWEVVGKMCERERGVRVVLSWERDGVQVGAGFGQ
jgi:hypothetical protein